MLVGEGALKFAESKGIPKIPTEDLITEKALIRYNKIKEFVPSVESEFVEGIMTFPGSPIIVGLYCCGQLWVRHMFCGRDLWWTMPLHIFH